MCRRFLFSGMGAMLVLLGIAGAAIAARAVEAVLTLPAGIRVSGQLSFEARVQRWGPLPATLPGDFKIATVLDAVFVHRLQKDPDYGNAVQADGYHQPVDAAVNGFHLQTPPLAPGIYSLYVMACDIQNSGRGKPPLGRFVWIIAVPPGSEPQSVGTLPIPVTAPHLCPGDPAPETNAPTLDGKPFHLSAARGHWALIDFWATWCPVCTDELPQIQALHKQFPDVAILGMCADENPATAKKYMQVKGYAWTNIAIGALTTSASARSWGVIVLPQIFIVDPRGKVAGSCLTLDEAEALLKMAKQQIPDAAS